MSTTSTATERTFAFDSYQDAAALLPDDAECTSEFGFSGCGGYSAYYRAGGKRFVIANGSWDASKPRKWTLTVMGAQP